MSLQQPSQQYAAGGATADQQHQHQNATANCHLLAARRLSLLAVSNHLNGGSSSSNTTINITNNSGSNSNNAANSMNSSSILPRFSASTASSSYSAYSLWNMMQQQLPSNLPTMATPATQQNLFDATIASNNEQLSWMQPGKHQQQHQPAARKPSLLAVAAAHTTAGQQLQQQQQQQQQLTTMSDFFFDHQMHDMQTAASNALKRRNSLLLMGAISSIADEEQHQQLHFAAFPFAEEEEHPQPPLKKKPKLTKVQQPQTNPSSIVSVSMPSSTTTTTVAVAAAVGTAAAAAATINPTAIDTNTPVRFRSYQADNWTDKYEELLEYRLTNGHCLVPNACKKNPSLAEWVKRQRYQRKLRNLGKHSTMSDDRIQALEMLGFVWNSHDAVWEERWKELAEFKRAHGHANVPSKHAENPQLAVWIKRQRRQYKFYSQKEPSTMTPKRIEKLTMLGFAWNGRQPTAKTEV